MISLPILAVPIHCINEAAIEYHVPARLIISVLQTERGKSGQIVKNRNGTYDIGLMQINSIWLPTLMKYGISQQDIQYKACVNVKVGAWILSKKIASGDNLLIGIGDYNSHTERFNKSYYHKVRIAFIKLNLMLD